MINKTFYSKENSQGISYYTNHEIEKIRYTQYRKANRRRAEHAYQNRVDFDFPKHIILETSGVCQCKCPFCYATNMKREKGLMKFDTFTRAIDEAAENLIFSVSMYAGGEPMLNKEIIAMAKYAKQQGIPYIDLSTNGLINFNELIPTQINEVIVSLDGIDQETYEENRPGGNYHHVVNNINSFIKARGDFVFPILRLQIIDMPSTEPYIEKFIDNWKDKVDVVYKKVYEEMGHIFKKEERDNTGRKPCKQLYFTLTVQWDGDLSFCCHSSNKKSVIGNLNKITLKQAWARIKTLRREQERGIFNDFCKECKEETLW